MECNASGFDEFQGGTRCRSDEGGISVSSNNWLRRPLDKKPGAMGSVSLLHMAEQTPGHEARGHGLCCSFACHWGHAQAITGATWRHRGPGCIVKRRCPVEAREVCKSESSTDQLVMQYSHNRGINGSYKELTCANPDKIRPSSSS